MREFMLYVRNAGDAKIALTAEKHLSFVTECEHYIGSLRAAGHLIAAQPLVRGGSLLKKEAGGWKTLALDPEGEIHVGYYHLQARDEAEAISLARGNPEFAYVPSASVEIHEIKTKEEETGFEYPR
ncbi:MAG TPA: hypothetical protein VMB23_08625 [Spirochaetia bacterium]|jgi:hypothetical protein|nr:hypothetical protein [Spirochaetia bacterium]